MAESGTILPGSNRHAIEITKDALERQVDERTAALRESEAALRENEIWLAAQKEVFQAVVNGASLEASLGILIRTAVDQWGNDTRCAFYMADADGAELHH